jgi:hypothetical protein
MWLWGSLWPLISVLLAGFAGMLGERGLLELLRKLRASDASIIYRVHAGMLRTRGLGLVVHFPSLNVARINIPWLGPWPWPWCHSISLSHAAKFGYNCGYGHERGSLRTHEILVIHRIHHAETRAKTINCSTVYAAAATGVCVLPDLQLSRWLGPNAVCYRLKFTGGWLIERWKAMTRKARK